MQRVTFRKIFNKIATFVPYAYHYSHDSVLTKNGELIKIIKLEHNNSDNNLREIIAKFLLESKNLEYSLWITTIRSKSNNKFNSFEKSNLSQFALQKIEQWDQFIATDHILKNELYLSIIMNDLTHFSDIKTNFNIISNFGQKTYADNLMACYSKCTAITNSFLHLLRDFSPKLLTMYKINDSHYSAILTFLSRITFINEDRPVPVPNRDLSQFLVNNSTVKSYYNTIKIGKTDNRDIKKFISMFTIKDHSIITKNITDEISECDFELVITETINLIDREEINSKKNATYFNNYKKENEFLKNNNEDKIFKEFVASDHKPELYLYKQTNIMVKADNLDSLDLYSYRLNLKFANNGIILYRHNVFIEEVFWSQLPGNFSYISRLRLVKLANLINFNNLTTIKDNLRNSLIFKNKLNNGLLKLETEKQNLFLLEGVKNSIDHAFLFFLISFLRFKLKIYFISDQIPLKLPNEYLTRNDKFYLQENKHINKNLLQQIFLSICVILSKITNFELTELINEKIDIIIDHFLNKEIEFNFSNILNGFKAAQIIDKNFLTLDKLKNNLYSKNISFLINQELSEEEDLILLILSMLIAFVEKTSLNQDIIFFIKNIAKFTINENLHKSFFEILFFANKFNLICFCDLSNCDHIQIDQYYQSFKKEEIIGFIFPDSEHRILKQVIIENLDQHLINSAFIRDGDKVFFIDFNMKNFIEGNRDIFELKS